jgi:antitoxin YefM
MTTLTVTQARRKLYSLVDEAHEGHRPVLIAGKRGSAVLISDEDWSSIQETLYLLSVPGMRESIRKGLATSLKSCARELKW